MNWREKENDIKFYFHFNGNYWLFLIIVKTGQRYLDIFIWMHILIEYFSFNFIKRFYLPIYEQIWVSYAYNNTIKFSPEIFFLLIREFFLWFVLSLYLIKLANRTLMLHCFVILCPAIAMLHVVAHLNSAILF